ncbi:MAG TPA: hypothetical protein VNP04_23270 [Alphaproteobacteria bacterium]|nr:hypothetical protein [Alphaproteobacteria bacterium]
MSADRLLTAGAAPAHTYTVFPCESMAPAVGLDGYNLAAGRYKPQVAEPALEEDPAELIREVLAIEWEIVDGLEKLLKEVDA